MRTEKENLVDTYLTRIAGTLAVGMIALVACTDSGDRGDARFQGLQTVVYAAPDLRSAKKWYAEALGIEPYFDEEFYVGFNVGGFGSTPIIFFIHSITFSKNPSVTHSPEIQTLLLHSKLLSQVPAFDWSINSLLSEQYCPSFLYPKG